MINKIRPFIEARGLSVYRFQKDTGVSPKTAYDLCNDPTQLPGSNVISKICDAYRVQPNEILEWVDPGFSD